MKTSKTMVINQNSVRHVVQKNAQNQNAQRCKKTWLAKENIYNLSITSDNFL